MNAPRNPAWDRPFYAKILHLLFAEDLHNEMDMKHAVGYRSER
jgi:hypothetical protein